MHTYYNGPRNHLPTLTFNPQVLGVNGLVSSVSSVNLGYSKSRSLKLTWVSNKLKNNNLQVAYYCKVYVLDE